MSNGNSNGSGSDRKKGSSLKSKSLLKMAKYGKIQMCSPYGMAVTCICDSRGRIVRCMFPDHSDDDLTGEAMLSRDDRSDASLLGNSDDLSGLDGLASASHGRGLDEKTEIILAATFLVLIILAFISFVIYRCEKSYMRRRLQESFHMSPSSGGLLCNGGMMTTNLNGNVNSHQIPTISVSVQTEPQFLSNLGLSNTTTLLANGGLQQQMNGNGSVLTSMQGNHATVSSHSYNNNYSATLPHMGGHLSHFATLQANNLGNGGTPGGCLNGNAGINHQEMIEDGVEPTGLSGHRHSIWSRDNLTAQSYRDMREIVALPPQTSNSRDNTLSRDILHINDRDLGMRNSGTTENLRSPSVAGTNCRDDDDINTDYAESDVMLNTERQIHSNGSGNENSAQQQRYIQ